MDVERDLIGFQRARFLLDIFRRILVVSLWVGILVVLLAATSWVWAVVWILPGLFLSVNVIGFVTLPLYAMLGLMPGVRRTKKRFFSGF